MSINKKEIEKATIRFAIGQKILYSMELTEAEKRLVEKVAECLRDGDLARKKKK